MKNTTKIILLTSFLWVTCTKFEHYSWQFFLSTVLLGAIFSAYRFFIIQSVVYEDDNSVNILVEYIKQRKEDRDE